MRQQPLRSVHLHQVASIHHRHPLPQHERLILIMGHVQARKTVTLMQAHNIGADTRAHLLIHTRQRLIKKNHRSTTNQSTRNTHTLSLTTRQLRRLTGLQPLKLQSLQQLTVVVHINPTGERTQPGRKQNIVLHTQVRVQNRALKHHTHRAAFQRLTGVGHPTGARFLQAGNNTQQSGLTGTRRTNQRNQLAGVHIQVNLIQNRRIGAKGLSDTSNTQAFKRLHRGRRVGCRSHSPIIAETCTRHGRRR